MISRYQKQDCHMLEKQLKTIGQGFQIEIYKREG